MNRINTNKQAAKLAIFLFFTFLSLTTVAQNKEKKITIQNKSISLKEAFAQIETQTGYSIAYEQSKLDIEKKQSLSLKNVTVDKAMTQLLKGTGYAYKIKGYHIIISSQELLNTFILGIERSIYSYDEFIFIQKSLLNIASILREKDNE